ncbi:MAG: hypothetical protein ACKVQW_06325 [Pyrinomonadaceae bacterium]
MIVRSIALSLSLLIGIGTIVPLATEYAEAGPKKKRKHRKQVKKYKKYSRAWWRQYRARMKRKRAMQARKRALRLRQLRLARAAAKARSKGAKPTATKVKKNTSAPAAAVLPSGDPAPAGWRPAQTSPAELQFRVDNSAGDQVGSASISVVGPAMGDSSSSGRSKSVGGVSTTALRRDVIDRMIRENGWVVNDYQKEISGQQVYVVVAQSQAKNGALQSRMFYFTEVDGKIYSVSTNSPAQEQERLAEESEKVINSLKSRVRPTQRASN